MADAPIKIALESPEFTTQVTPAVRTRLERCLRSDADHIMPRIRGGQDGPHVQALQQALRTIKEAMPPGLGLLDIADPPGVYGQSTAAAVRRYKELYAIRRAGQPLDDIVGRMTISHLDDDLRSLHVQPGPSPTPTAPASPATAGPGKAPCTQNKNIRLDGTTADKRSPPMAPGAWVAKTQSVLDVIYSNQLGKKIVEAVRQDVVIRPFLGNEQDSLTWPPPLFSGTWIVEFTAEVYDTTTNQPGGSADENLFHELIHVLERSFRGYQDLPDKSLRFDRSDFLTISGTNVYSATRLTRKLRRDHYNYQLMPERYATDAREHMILLREDYEKAFDNNSALLDLFKNQFAPWNPFTSFSRDVTKMQFLVEVSADKHFRWLYDLYSDSTARWNDPGNVAEYGTGTWRQEGAVIIVDWKGGGFDRFRLGGINETVAGRNRTGGIERDSKVWRQ